MGVGTRAGSLGGQGGRDAEQKPAKDLEAALKHPEDFGLRHRRAGVDAGIKVGHEGDGGVAQRQLSGQAIPTDRP